MLRFQLCTTKLKSGHTHSYLSDPKYERIDKSQLKSLVPRGIKLQSMVPTPHLACPPGQQKGEEQGVWYITKQHQ